MLKENGNIRNIFSSYLYGKRLDIYLKDLHEHVLDVKRKGEKYLKRKKEKQKKKKNVKLRKRNIINEQ